MDVSSSHRLSHIPHHGNTAFQTPPRLLLKEVFQVRDCVHLSDAGEALLSAQLLQEITVANTQPLPHAQQGDKRLRALCEAVLRTPRWPNGQPTQTPANAPWRGCSVTSWASANR
jgi:hypothetical protein